MSLNQLDLAAVEDFLKMAAKEIKKNNVYLVQFKYINGKKVKTEYLLKRIGIKNVKEIWEYILTLTKDDCIDISFDYDKSKDFNTEVFEFKKMINNKLVYIKLTIRDKLVCMSFHIDHYR